MYTELFTNGCSAFLPGTLHMQTRHFQCAHEKKVTFYFFLIPDWVLPANTGLASITPQCNQLVLLIFLRVPIILNGQYHYYIRSNYYYLYYYVFHLKYL